MRYVISDIHGCSKTFEVLLDKIQLSPGDSLYLLGDYIEKTNDGHLVIDKIIELQEKDYKVFPLRGNHEQYLLDAYMKYGKDEFREYISMLSKSPGLLSENGEINPKYLYFFEQLPYYVLLDDYLLVHAGLDYNKVNPFEEFLSMLEVRTEIRKLEKLLSEKNLIGERSVIFGHQVYPYQVIVNQIKAQSKVIPLDNGCYYKTVYSMDSKDEEKYGRLCCFNMDSRELVFVENIEKQFVKKRKLKSSFDKPNQDEGEREDDNSFDLPSISFTIEPKQKLPQQKNEPNEPEIERFEQDSKVHEVLTFKAEPPHDYGPKINDWIVGGFYYFEEKFPTVKYLIRIVSKTEVPEWGIKLNIEIIYDLKMKRWYPEIENIIEVSYKHGHYGATYMWTMDYIDESLLNMYPHWREIITEYLKK